MLNTSYLDQFMLLFGLFMVVVFFVVYRSQSGTKTDDTDDSHSDEWISNTIQLLRSNQNNLVACAILAVQYYMTYLDKNEAIAPA